MSDPKNAGDDPVLEPEVAFDPKPGIIERGMNALGMGAAEGDDTAETPEDVPVESVPHPKVGMGEKMEAKGRSKRGQ
jgi:hypothetical protein